MPSAARALAVGMRAVGLQETGGPEVLTVVELPEPEPGRGEVRIAVAGAAVNPTDTGLRAVPQMAPQDVPPPWVPGMDAAGVVDAVGEGVDLAVGDRVAAVVNPRRPKGGAYVERLVVPAASVVRVPDDVDLLAASTLPMNGLTAVHALRSLRLPERGTVAVTGAAGTLGAYVVALAHHAGHRVVADAKEGEEDLVRSFGADDVLPRGDGFADAVRALVPGGADGLVDAAVTDDQHAAAVRDGGVVATVRGYDGGGRPDARGVRYAPVMVFEHLEDTASLRELVERVVDGTLVLRVAGTVPPERAADAHRRLEAGGQRGRVVITF